MGQKFIFKNDKVGEFHLETSDVKLPDIIKNHLHNYTCVPEFGFNGFKLVSDNLTLLQRPCFFEWQTIKVVFIPTESGSNDRYSLLVNDTEELKSDNYGGRHQIIGNVQVKNYVGKTGFKVVNKYNEAVFELVTEIFPQKLDYKNDFKKMISEITEILYALIYDYLKKTYSIVTPREQQRSTLTEWLAILKALFDPLEKSMQLILRSPHSKIVTTKRTRQIDKIRKIDSSASKWIVKNQRYLSKNGTSGFQIQDGIFSSFLQESRKRITYNTFENRFIKWAIGNIILQMEMARQELKSLKLNPDDLARAELELLLFRKTLIRHLRNPVFHQVDEFQHQMDFSTVLTMAPGYKDFYFRFLLLRRGLSISDNDIFKLDYKDIATLYEYWCFLKTIKILREEPFSYNLESTDIIKLEHTRFTIDLKKGSESEIRFSKYDTGESFILAYNRGFRTPTYMQVPDNFIEFRKGAEYVNPFRYIMDAKYRFTREDEHYPETLVKNGPPLDTIAQLHRYRDAILSRSPGKHSYSEAIKSLGGIILFPFPNNEEEFTNHKFFQSIRDVNIGAIPLRPGSENNLYKQFLVELLETTPEYLYEQTINYDKTDYNRTIEEMRMPVLIGLVPSDSIETRLNFMMQKKIYYIPKAKEYLISPEEIRYVAINPSTTNAITYYGAVKDVRPKTAEELKNMGATWSQSRLDYMVFYLSELIPCNIPFSMMTSLGRRYTNLYSLKKAMEPGMHDVIFLTNPEQVRMWKEIVALDKDVQILRSSHFDRFNKKDQSEISFAFNYMQKKYRSLQSSHNPWDFKINESDFSLNQNLRQFLINQAGS